MKIKRSANELREMMWAVEKVMVEEDRDLGNAVSVLSELYEAEAKAEAEEARQDYIDSFKFRLVRCGKGVPAWDIMMDLEDGTSQNMGMVSNFPMEKSFVCTLRADKANEEIELRHKNRDDMLKAIRVSIADRQERLEFYEEEEAQAEWESWAEGAAMRHAEEQAERFGSSCHIENGVAAPF